MTRIPTWITFLLALMTVASRQYVGAHVTLMSLALIPDLGPVTYWMLERPGTFVAVFLIVGTVGEVMMTRLYAEVVVVLSDTIDENPPILSVWTAYLFSSVIFLIFFALLFAAEFVGLFDISEVAFAVYGLRRSSPVLFFVWSEIIGNGLLIFVQGVLVTAMLIGRVQYGAWRASLNFALPILLSRYVPVAIGLILGR